MGWKMSVSNVRWNRLASGVACSILKIYPAFVSQSAPVKVSEGFFPHIADHWDLKDEENLGDFSKALNQLLENFSSCLTHTRTRVLVMEVIIEKSLLYKSLISRLKAAQPLLISCMACLMLRSNYNVSFHLSFEFTGCARIAASELWLLL